MPKISKFIDEWTIVSGKGTKRKAIKKAFQNLHEYGIGNWNTVSVLSKQNFQNKHWKSPLYEVMIRASKSSNELFMREYKWTKGNYLGVTTTHIHKNDPRIPIGCKNQFPSNHHD